MSQSKYNRYVQGIELEPDIRFHGFSEASVLIHSLFNGYGGTIAFANEYFDQKHEYCLIWLAVYRQAESLIKTWERDPDCAASLSKDMYQATINNNVLNHMLVRMGEHEYSTTLSNFKNIFFVGSDNSMLPVKDNEKKTVVIAKSSITELATKGGKVFWERHKDKNG